MNENVDEEDRTTAKTQLVMSYAKVNGWIMRIRMWQNEHQRSINDFSFCMPGY